MASKTTLLTALFDQFISFTTELSQMYPDDADFSMFTTTLRMLKTTNPSLLPKYIYENVEKYEEQLMSKDEAFIMGHSFEEHGNDVDLNIFAKLKGYLTNMTPDSKDNVWKYSQNIWRLTKAYRGLANAQ